MNIDEKLKVLIETPSDINEHLVTLRDYAARCEHVTEMGVRWIVSTYAFLAGRPKTLVAIDMTHPQAFGADISTIENYAKELGCLFRFIEANTLHLEIDPTDLLFIDTWHAYKQLSAELGLHHTKVRKYIILHDTTSYSDHDEASYIELGEHWQPQGMGL